MNLERLNAPDNFNSMPIGYKIAKPDTVVYVVEDGVLVRTVILEAHTVIIVDKDGPDTNVQYNLDRIGMRENDLVYETKEEAAARFNREVSEFKFMDLATNRKTDERPAHEMSEECIL